MASLGGSLVDETFSFDGGRRVTMYLPPGPRRSVVYAIDGGWHTERLAHALEASAEGPSTMVIGVDGVTDDGGRLNEYVESLGGARFETFARFVVEEVHAWATSESGVRLPAGRTAIWGASSGGEFALAMGLRHPAMFGHVFCASPGGGFSPTARQLPRKLPRTYLIGGTQEQWFFDNASGWATALRNAGGDVVIERRHGEHGGQFWYDEFPLMIAWAFAR